MPWRYRGENAGAPWGKSFDGVLPLWLTKTAPNRTGKPILIISKKEPGKRVVLMVEYSGMCGGATGNLRPTEVRQGPIASKKLVSERKEGTYLDTSNRPEKRRKKEVEEERADALC